MNKPRVLKTLLMVFLAAGLLALIAVYVVLNELGDPDEEARDFAGRISVDLPDELTFQYSFKLTSAEGDVDLKRLSGLITIPLDTETGCFEGRLAIVDAIDTDSVVYSRERDDLCFVFDGSEVNEDLSISEEEFLRGHP